MRDGGTEGQSPKIVRKINFFGQGQRDGHNGLLDSYFFQTTSISYPGFPWVSGGRGRPTELDFKGSRCDLESMGVLEAKNLETLSNLIKKCLF